MLQSHVFFQVRLLLEFLAANTALEGRLLEALVAFVPHEMRLVDVRLDVAHVTSELSLPS